VVRRWFHAALVVPLDHPLLPLFWQMAFRLLFARMHLTKHALPTNLGGFYGFRFLTGTSGRQLAQQCREHLNALSVQMAKRRQDAIQALRPGHNLHPSVYELPALFQAMALWLTDDSRPSAANAEPAVSYLSSLRERLLGFGVSLPEKYLAQRLASILLPPAHRNVPLWWDLVDVLRLRGELVAEVSSASFAARTAATGVAAVGMEMLPSIRGFAALLNDTPEMRAHAFFHRYYVTQNYPLPRYAPTPRQVIALFKRRVAPATSSPGNPFMDVSSETEARSLCSAAEYASTEVASVPPSAAEAAAAHKLQQKLQQHPAMMLQHQPGGGPASKRRKNSLGYWNASVSPQPPAPVLSGGADMAAVAASAAAGAGASLTLRVPSVLTVSLWDLLHEVDSSLLPLVHATRAFSERFSRSTALDRQLLDFLPALYRNDPAQHVHVQPCRQGLMGASRCRMPVSFLFNYSRAFKLRHVAEGIDANRAQASSCAGIDLRACAAAVAAGLGEEVSASLCGTLIAVQRLLHHIGLVAAQPVRGEAPLRPYAEGSEGGLLMPGSGSPPGGMGNVQGGEQEQWSRAVVQAGLRWLFALIDLDNAVTSLFPPAHHFVQVSVASLTPLLGHPYLQSVGLQERLLDVLPRHLPLLPTLTAALRPEVASDPQAYLNLLRLAVQVRDAQGVTSVQVLCRFDIPRWLAQQPTPPLAARQQLLTLCVQQLREEERRPHRRVGHALFGNSPVAQASEALTGVYALMLAALVRAQPADMFAPFLRVLLEELRAFTVSGSPFVPVVQGGGAAASAPSVGGPARAPTWLISLWRVLPTLPLHTLEWAAVSSACAQLEACLWEARRAHAAQVEQLLFQKAASAAASHPPVLKQGNVRLHALLGDLLAPVVQFPSALAEAMHPGLYPAALHESANNACVGYASSEAKKRAAWNSLWQCFSAFCAPDPPSVIAANDSAAAVPPSSHAFLSAQQSCMLGELMRCMSSLSAGSRRSDNWVMASFWHTYAAQITVSADVDFLVLLHGAVVAHTKVHQLVEPDEPAGAPEPPFRPIPSPPVLDFHASWRLDSADLMAFTHVLRQAIELHERELAALMAAEQARRDAEHAQQLAHAKGNAKKLKSQPQAAAPVTRQDVRLMSQASAKVGHVASFIAHLIASADWAWRLQPNPAQQRQPHALGILQPVTMSNPYELFAPSPASEYTSTLLLSLVAVLLEQPMAPFNSSRSSAGAGASDGGFKLLPHVQFLFDVLLRLDWSAILLVKLPAESFELRRGRRGQERFDRAREVAGGVDDPALLVAIEGDVDDAPVAVPLPHADEVRAMAKSALEREVGSAESLLEQISGLLYADRAQARIIEEVQYISQVAAASSSAQAAAAAAAASKQGLLSSLLSAPFAALMSASGLGASASPSLDRDAAAGAAASSASSASPRSPHAPLPPLTDVDVYGLVRPAFNRATNALTPRFILDDASGVAVGKAENDLSTPMSRVFLVFRLLARVCGPHPPVLFLANQASVIARHFFLPLVSSLRKARLFAEWLLSVFHGDAAPRPLMHEAQYLHVSAALLSELDAHHDAIQRVVGDRELIPLIQEYMFVANLDSRGVAVTPAVRALTQRIFASEWPQLTLLAFTASCRSIVSLNQLSTFLESTLHAWMLTHGIFARLASSPAAHWQVVAAALQVPQLGFGEFVDSCQRNGCVLTLHQVALQQFMQASNMLDGQQQPQLDAGAEADPLVKQLLPQPRTSFGLVPAPAAAAAVGAPAFVEAPSPLLEAKPLQQRVEQLAQWLQKVQVKDAASGSSSSASASSSSAASVPIRPSPKHAAVADEDAEPIKLLVALRTLLEMQGALVAAYLHARGQPAHQCVQQAQGGARWSNPLLASLRVYPDPFPLLASADALLDQLQALLLRWLGEMRSSAGVLGMLGMSSSHRYSPRFRMLLRALHTFLMLHVQVGSAAAAQGLASGQLKPAKAGALHFAWGADASGPQGAPLNASQRAAVVAACVAQLSGSKSFAPHSGTLRVVAATLAQAADRDKYKPDQPAQSTFVPLLYAPLLLDQLVACIFPELQ